MEKVHQGGGGGGRKKMRRRRGRRRVKNVLEKEVEKGNNRMMPKERKTFIIDQNCSQEKNTGHTINKKYQF